MNSSWELKEIAYAANENRATGTVESKTVGLELHHAMVIAYVWAVYQLYRLIELILRR